MEFRLLGPLEVWGDGGEALQLGGQKRRALLALLLLHANEVLSSDRLIEELWGEEPPQAAATALHGHISRLRKLLPGEQLVTSPPGYVLRLEPGQLDLNRFATLRDEARAARSQSDLDGASAKLREALSLWRGPALADLAYERFAEVEAARLEELRLATIEERVDVDLALGRQADLVPELERLVHEQPLREGFRVQLMLALYRSGRQAEALQAYHEARRALLEELGIDPSPRLRELEQAILRQDESLGAPSVAAEPSSGPRRERRRLIPVLVVCAVVVSAAIGLVFGLRGGEATAVYRPGTVLLDAKTGKRTAFVPPSVLLQPTAPVFANGHIWLLNAETTVFVEIDPASGKVLKQFPAPRGVDLGRAAHPFAVGRHYLWATDGDDLVKIDPRLRRQVFRVHLDKLTKKNGRAQGVALGGGLVWVGRDVGLGEVVAFDPGTRQIKHRYENVMHHVDLASDAGVVWAADSAGVDVIDPSTDDVETVQAIHSVDPFYGQISAPSAVAAGDGFGWTTNPAKGVLYKIDRSGNIADQYTTGLGATGASFTEGAVWVRNEDVGTVSRVDPVTGEQKVYRFGRPVAAEVAGGGMLLAALEPGQTIEDRFDGLPPNSLRLFSKTGPLDETGEVGLEWDNAARQLEFATCANLLRYPDKPAPEGSRLVPEVAAAMPSLSRDRRTYTFTIRPGYRFAPGGEPLTAETFRYSIERAFSPKLGSFRARSAIQDIKGEQAFLEGKSVKISGLSARGKQLSITLVEPSPSFLYRLGSAANCPVPDGTPLYPGAADRPVGANAKWIPSAGPYYIAEWRRDKYEILKPNPFYRGLRPHRLAAIWLREGVSAGNALERIEHRGWDGVVGSGQTGSDWGDRLLAPDGPIQSRYRQSSPGELKYDPVRLDETGFVVLNTARGAFTDPRLRKAVAFALDRTAIAHNFYQLPSDQLLPPGASGFHERRLYPLRPAPTKAAGLVGRRRPKVVLGYVPYDSPNSQEARLLKAELDAVGFRVELKPLPDDTHKLFRVLSAATRNGPPIDLVDGGTFGPGTDGAGFLVNVLQGAVPLWATPEMKNSIAEVNGLSGRARDAATAALADRLDERDLSVVPYGNRVEGDLFAPSAACRVFPPGGYGVDLAALCRRDS